MYRGPQMLRCLRVYELKARPATSKRIKGGTCLIVVGWSRTPRSACRKSHTTKPGTLLALGQCELAGWDAYLGLLLSLKENVLS